MYKTKIDNLDLKQIADSGQCFRWKNTGENEYTVVAFDRALRIKQDGNEFELDCDEADWNNIWKSYLDMDTDYAGIAKLIADGDDAHLKEAYAYGSGVRILRQDLWEMIVTFMISQNNNIKRITNSCGCLIPPGIPVWAVKGYGEISRLWHLSSRVSAERNSRGR